MFDWGQPDLIARTTASPRSELTHPTQRRHADVRRADIDALGGDESMHSSAKARSIQDGLAQAGRHLGRNLASDKTAGESALLGIDLPAHGPAAAPGNDTHAES